MLNHRVLQWLFTEAKDLNNQVKLGKLDWINPCLSAGVFFEEDIKNE